MKIAFAGKGGSGKTTVATAFGMYLHQQQFPTLLCDADVNMHVHRILGIPSDSIVQLSRHNEEVTTYLRGTRTDIPDDLPLLGITPPSQGSQWITLDSTDKFITNYTTQTKHTPPLVTIGTYEGEDIGFTCYHGKSDIFVMMLQHLYDRANEYIVVDSVTGIDNVSTPLIYAYDLNVIIVEPTQKSVQVYKDFIQGISTLPFSVPVAVIGNKITSPEDENYIQAQLPEAMILGWIGRSSAIKRMDQGELEAHHSFIQTYNTLWEATKTYASQFPRDWDLYLTRMHHMYITQTKAYYDAYYNTELATLVSPQIHLHV